MSKRKKIDFERDLHPIYIKSFEANQFYLTEIEQEIGNKVEHKIKDKWIKLDKIKIGETVMNDSLFLRFMRKSIVWDTEYNSMDFINVKFSYDLTYRIDGVEQKEDKHDLRMLYYENGLTYVHEKKNRKGDVVSKHPIRYKMLMRSTGKAKDGECIFIRENLHHKAINFLTMGLYDLMDAESKKDPDKVFDLVAISAYQTLTTATALEGYIHIPLENMLIIRDEEVYSDPMKAEVVTVEDVEYEDNIFVLEFDSPRLEAIINKKGFTFDENKAKEKGLILIKKTRESLKENGIRINGKFPGHHEYPKYTKKECVVNIKNDERIKNVLWDGMGLCSESIFPRDKGGFIYCRSHFFKSCLFRGNIQQFFKDYCKEKGIDYETHTLETVDLFQRKIKLSDVQVIVTDKSIKWLKSSIIGMMGENKNKAYQYYRKYMKELDDCFSIVKTSHPSKWGDLQLSAYQMNNSLPCTDETILGQVAKCSVDFLNRMKLDDNEYLKYLYMRRNKFNINEVLLELVQHNSDFVKTEFFRIKKSKDISKLKDDVEHGKLLQSGDNLTIMDNPIALLMKVMGENPLDEGCFELMIDGVQCYTPRFNDGDRIAAFRSPHNSPNNIIHLYNVYPEKLLRYFPNIGENVIVFNAIKTDTQPRLSGHDCDTDFVYATNQIDVANLARKAYVEYPTILNKVDESGSNTYHFTPKDYAKMDNQISDAQTSIGTSTDIAQLALSYYYDEGMENRELEKCFIILSVIGQISIDLAKKSFDIDIVKEIRRIKNLTCMKNRDIPKFFADNKANRNNKEYGEKVVIRSMNCPMDILSNIIDKNVIKYPPREYHLPMRDFWNHDIKGKGKKDKKDKVIAEAEKYNTSDRWLEDMKSKLNEDVYIELKNRAMTQFLNRASNNLDDETIMQLVIYATNDDNSAVCKTILNFLFRNHKEKFVNCFVKKDKNEEKNL